MPVIRAFSCARHGIPALTFNSARCHALNNVLLAGQVENDNRNNAHQDQRHRCAQIHRAVASLQVLDMNGNGAVFIDIKHQHRQK